MSAKNPTATPSTPKPQTAAQKKRAAAAAKKAGLAAVTDAAARAIAPEEETTPPADTQTPLALASAESAEKVAQEIAAIPDALLTSGRPVERPPTARQKRAAEKAAEQAKKDAPKVEGLSIPERFNAGQTIATIARTIQKPQADVRAALDEAGVDYSADKSAKPIESSRGSKATPAKTASGPKTLLDSYQSILAKKVEKGSKRDQVIASLSTGQNEEDLQAIVKLLADLGGVDLAKAANALNATLSAHYARP